MGAVQATAAAADAEAAHQKMRDIAMRVETLVTRCRQALEVPSTDDVSVTRVSWLERGRLDDQKRVKQIQDDATILMKQVRAAAVICL